MSSVDLNLSQEDAVLIRLAVFSQIDRLNCAGLAGTSLAETMSRIFRGLDDAINDARVMQSMLDCT